MSALQFLLLEDRIPDTEAIQSRLRDGGIDCELLRVDTRADFVVALETQVFDLILAAYAMPGFDGLAALDIASNLCPGVPFIFVSASLGEELAIETLKRGATDYVLKQRLERLVSCVQRALREAQERRERQAALCERKRAEANLCQSEARLRAVAANLPNAAVFLVDHNLRYLLAEGKALAGAGMTSEDLVGKTLWEALDPALSNRYEAYYRQALGGKPFQYEHCSHDRHYISHGTPLYNDRGEVDAVLVVSYDITDRVRAENGRKWAEASLQQSEEQIRNILESINDGFFALDEDWRFTYVNQAAEGLTHRTAVELLGKNFWEEFPGVAGSEFEQLHRCAMHDRVAGSITAFYPDHDRWYSVHSYPAAQGITVYFRDVTAQMQAEEALRQSEERFQAFMNHSPAAYWITDRDGRLIYLNQTYFHLFQLVTQDVIGKTVHDIYPTDIAQQFLDNIQQAADTHQVVETTEFAPRFDGTMGEFLVYKFPIANESEAVLVGGVAIDITERKQAEAVLYASHDTFRYLVEHSPFGVYVVDADFRLAQVSAGAQKIFENVRPLIGRDFAEVLRVVWTEPFASEAIACFRHTLETGEPYHSPSTIERRHDISVVESYDWKIERITLLDGRFGVVCHFYDLSERQRYEAALRESEEQFRNMADNAPVMIWVTDPTGYCTYLSQSWYDFTGQTEETGLGFGWLSRVHPDDREMAERIFLNANQRQEAFSLEYRLQNKDGEYIWAIDAASPRFGVNGQFKGYIGSVLDISDRKHSEAALRESENRLRLALESAELGTWDFNPTTGILQWDARCKAMFGLSPESEINYDIFLAGLHPEDRDRTHQVVQFSLNPESGGEYDIEYRTVGIEDGVERWIAAKGKAFFNSAGIAIRFIGTVLNITDTKWAEAEREQLLQREQAARETAERANRIKDEFLAVLSHELRSPLNPILGWTRLLQNGKLDPARQTEALKTIERNAKLQTQLIEDLLDISRIMQGKLSLTAAPVSLTFVITAAVETVRLAAEAKNIQILLDLTTATAPVSGDAARLQQVVWNLLTNAVKFTPSGGQVTVELRQLDRLAQIRVIDTGKGISPQFLPYVFEYFRQADSTTTRKFGGLGLGLAIVRQIVEMHGGTVEAESLGEDQGATFTIQLPVIQQAIPTISESPQAKAENTAAPLSNLQILVVDDDADTREFQLFLLEQSGAKVTAVASGFEALLALDRFTPDVLVSDVGMAEMDGYMLMQQIRSRPRDKGGMIPAIALTAYARDFDQQQALQAGFQRHLTKPIEPDQLILAVVMLTQRSTHD